ncbi:SitI3 family protein [Archangium sp.]|uniref:SitI3 family protein n=1 Tax=Archangium sp. TaxID=1872627 RepID=UPI002D2DDB7D|nr:SitI3 family protein [Archangium sp.]HYO60164.1 SitI3 family protein [Archangium sp.]
MALEYSLELSTSMRRTQALEALAGRVDGLTWGRDGIFLLGSTITISASEPPGIARKVIERGFKFVPTLSIGFRFISNTDYEIFGKIMLQGTMLLLEHAQDAVLLFNEEIIVLQRLGGQLAFNSDYHIWDDDDWLRSRINIPFERRPLPSPLL